MSAYHGSTRHGGDDSADIELAGNAGFGFIYADGRVVGESGNATFTASLSKGTRLYNDTLELDETFEDSMTAEIHLIIRYHGEVDPGRI